MGSSGTTIVNDSPAVDEHIITNGHIQSDTMSTPYIVSGEPIHKKRPIRIICIGAGIAGIAAAYKYQKNLSNATFVIYEKNQDVGGTWLENRYPGCACW